MARARRIRWPVILVTSLLVGAVALVVARPSLLAPLITRMINRQLGGEFSVGAYEIRPFVGVDAYDVSLGLPGEGGGHTLVAVDTLAVDFNLREVLGLDVRLRRLAATGVQVFHLQDEPAAGEDRELSVPRLRIDLAIIDGARVEVSDHQGRLRERIERLDWRGELQADGHGVTAVTRRGHVVWPTRNAELSRLDGRVRVDAAGLAIEHLSGIWNGGEVDIAGLIGEDVVELVASGRDVEAVWVTDLTGIELDFAARGDVEIEISALGDTIALAADFTGRFEEWNLRAVHGEAVVTSSGARFHRLVGGVEDAHFDGSLVVDDTGMVTIEGAVRDVDLRYGLIPGTDPDDLPRTTGHGRVRIVHTPSDLATHVTGVLLAGDVDIMPFDSCAVDVWAVDDSLHFRRIDLRHASMRAQLTGTSNRREEFSGLLDLTIGDLGDIPAHWQWPALAGRAGGRVVLSGVLDDLVASGSVTYRDLGLGPFHMTAGEATVVAERVLGEDWSLSAATDGPGFFLGDVPLGDYRLRLRGDATSAVVDSFLAVRGDTVVTIHGRADFQPDQAMIRVDRGAVVLAGNRWQLGDEVTASVGPGKLHVPGLNLVSDHGTLAAHVLYSVEDSLLVGRLELDGFDVNLLDPFLRERFRPGGVAVADVVIGGTPADPEVAVRGSLVGARFDVATIDSLNLEARFVAGAATIDTLGLASDQGRIALAGVVANPEAPLSGFWNRAALDLDLVVADGDLAFLQQFENEALASLSGQVDGVFRVTGSTDDPVIRGNLESRSLRFQWLKLDRLRGNVHVDRTQLALGELVGNQDHLELTGRIELPLRFDLLSAPESPPDGPFLAQVAVDEGSDLGPLLDATSAFTRIEGRGGGELIVSGPMSRPGYQGRLAVQGVGFVLRGNEEVFRNCQATAVFHDDRLEILSVTGEEGLRGTFAGRGQVLFDGLVLETWDIEFSADRFLVASIPDLRAVVRTRNGRFTGVPVGPDRVLVPRFEGEFDLIKGRYTGDFAEPGAGLADPTLGNVAPDWLADIRIIGSPRSGRIVNNTMELELSGDVTLVRDADGMVINGGLTIDNGRLPVFHNTFRVVRGGLDFSQGVGVIPVVDIDAETRVRVRSQVAGQSRVERLTVHAVGPASAMAISYSSESGYPREAIERMLLGLSPYPDEQGDQGALTSASIGAGFNIIEREIAREIEIFDTIEIDQIRREQPQGGMGLDPLIGVGKYISTDLYIKYARGLNQNDQDLLIEYQINDLLLLQTEIRRRIDEYQGDPSYNLDLKYRYEY